MLETIMSLLGVSCEDEIRKPHVARICLLKILGEHDFCLSLEQILSKYGRGKKGYLVRVLKYLMEQGFVKKLRYKNTELYCLTTKGLALVHPDPPCPELFLAGAYTALRVAYESGVKVNWLLSAGRYWGGNGFRNYSKDLEYVKGLGGLVFLDSGAQQFFTKFKSFNYPYLPKEYLDFALKVKADLVATLDLPLDILTPRGLSVQEGIRKTVELGVEVVEEAEKLGIVEKVVPVLQGYNDPSQWLECLDMYKEHGIKPSKFRTWGIGSLCMSRSVRLTETVLKEVRRAVGSTVKLHVFGLNLRHLRRVYRLIDSYDTAAWIYWAKIDGAVLVWSPRRKAFIHLQARDGRRYDTETLMEVNLRQVLFMHKWLCETIRKENKDKNLLYEEYYIKRHEKTPRNS